MEEDVLDLDLEVISGLGGDPVGLEEGLHGFELAVVRVQGLLLVGFQFLEEIQAREFSPTPRRARVRHFAKY